MPTAAEKKATQEKLNANGSSPEKEDNLLSVERLMARSASRTKRVFIKELDAEVVIQKLPASIVERSDLGDLSPIVLALTEGVKEPKINEAIMQAMTFEEANAIYEEVEKFNPGVIGGSDNPEEVSAERRKAFPA